MIGRKWYAWEAPVTNVLNTMQAAITVVLYIILTKPTADAPGPLDDDHLVSLSSVTAIASFFVVIFAAAEVVAFGFYGGSTNVRLAFGVVSGLACSVSLGMLVGRLESSYLGFPAGVLAVLYAYAAIQPFFPLFDPELPRLLSERETDNVASYSERPGICFQAHVVSLRAGGGRMERRAQCSISCATPSLFGLSHSCGASAQVIFVPGIC